MGKLNHYKGAGKFSFSVFDTCEEITLDHFPRSKSGV